MAQRLCLLLLLVASWEGVVRSQSNYCAISSQHTLCINRGLGETCGNQVQFRGVSAQDAALILAQHNQLRSRVALGQEGRGAPGPQPPASNMRLLEWDDELALVAQSHADQCIFEHECSDCRRVSRFGVGQNLFISFQSNFQQQIQWGRAIQAWYDEVAEFNPGAIQPFRFSTPVGHYTQMLWWNTYKMGCGFTMYREGGWWKKLYTCNYGPGGNIIFSEMYRRGSPCSTCPAGTSCSLQYPGLCEDDNAFDSTTGFMSDGVPSAVATTPASTLGLPVNTDNNEADNEIPRVPVKPTTTNNNDIFSGFNVINSINPDDVNIEALIEFFNTRGRGPSHMRMPSVSVLNSIFNGRKPSLVTARLTATTTTGTEIDTATVEPTTPSTTTSPSTTSVPPTTTVPAITTTTSPTTTSIDITTTTTPLPFSTIPPNEISSTTPSSSEGPAEPTTFNTNQVLQQRTGTPAVFRTNVPSVAPAPIFPAFSQFEQQEQEFEPQEPQEAEFEPPEVEAQEQQDQENLFVPMRGEQPQVSDLMPFLQRAGVNTQVIRTQTLSSVQSIINSLPFGLKPIVLFRSGTGQLTELDAGTLLPLRRFGRSTTTTRGPKKAPGVLLTCDLDVSPCEITPVGANWTISSTSSEGRFIEAALDVGEGAQIVYQKLVAAPSTEGVCVAMSHRRTLAEGASANSTLPELMVGVMPLGGEVVRETVGGAPGLWEMSRVSFLNVKTPFLILMTIAPASYPAMVSLDALEITEGLCCLSGIC